MLILFSSNNPSIALAAEHLRQQHPGSWRAGDRACAHEEHATDEAGHASEPTGRRGRTGDLSGPAEEHHSLGTKPRQQRAVGADGRHVVTSGRSEHGATECRIVLQSARSGR